MVTPLNQNLVDWLEKRRLRNPANGDPDLIPGRKICIYSLPKVGKTVLSAKLGKHNMFITDEDGYTSLTNDGIGEIGHWDSLPFIDWPSTKQMLQAIEAGQLKCVCGEPIDNIILDTMSGMIAETLQQIIASGTTPKDGKISPEAAGRPDYLISRERLIPVMKQIAQIRNVSVTILMHMREVGKVNPVLMPDAHNAAAEVINKYVSVTAYLFMDAGQRKLRVQPGSNVVAGSRYSFPDVFVTDDEFVAHIEKWKGQI